MGFACFEGSRKLSILDELIEAFLRGKGLREKDPG
tara:strand:- start:946 stop:1050 length:105 start_codon:yes stop_codon:yes gene_type:complete